MFRKIASDLGPGLFYCKKSVKEVKTMSKEFYTVAEIMQIMGLSRTHAYKLLGNEIPVIRLGRKILIPGWFIRKLAEEPQK